MFTIEFFLHLNIRDLQSNLFLFLFQNRLWEHKFVSTIQRIKFYKV